MVGAPTTLLLFRQKAESGTVLALVRILAGLWLPALSCFAGFWFSLKHAHDAATRIDRAKLVGVLAFTGIYFAICLLAVGLIIFQDYPPDSASTALLVPPSGRE